MGERWYTGNAEVDGQDRRGWLLGHFMPADDVRSTDAVEVKWGVHPAGDARIDWVPGDERTAVVVLVDGGPFVVGLRSGEVELAKQGDYVVYGPGVDHLWRALERSVVLTVRWPSE